MWRRKGGGTERGRKRNGKRITTLNERSAQWTSTVPPFFAAFCLLIFWCLVAPPAFLDLPRFLPCAIVINLQGWINLNYLIRYRLNQVNLSQKPAELSHRFFNYWYWKKKWGVLQLVCLFSLPLGLHSGKGEVVGAGWERPAMASKQ